MKWHNYVTFALILLVGGLLWFQDSKTNERIDELNALITGLAIDDSAPAQQAFNMEPLVDDDAIKGNPEAKITIVEFSDYECPFCQRFYTETLQQLEAEYIDTGQVRFVYRDLPLVSIHPNAQEAAEAAECAGEQEMYYQMHDMLFERGVVGGIESFKQYAAELGLDTEEFNTCLETGAMADEVNADAEQALALGINSTPNFVINGILISGAQPIDVFRQVIDAELAKLQ